MKKKIPISFLHELDHMRQSLRDLLKGGATYDADAVTTFVAEGFLMYLTGAEVEEILSVMRDYAAPGSRMVFTFLEECRPGNLQFRNAGRLVSFWLRVKGEPFTWGLPLDDVAQFLQKHGFELREVKTGENLAAEFLAEPNRRATLALGEAVATALSA